MLRSGFADLEMDATALRVRVGRDRFERIDRHRAETVRRDADPDVVTGKIFLNVTDAMLENCANCKYT